jgi:hypothetical protein
MLAGQHRPSPRVLSQLFMKGEEGLPSMYNRTALLAFFGKLNPRKPTACQNLLLALSQCAHFPQWMIKGACFIYIYTHAA